MTSKSLSFSLTLSTTELGWLAGAFSLTRLALPIVIPLLSEDALRRAQESLAMRGLIRRDPGTGWQTDRLAAFLVQWLGAGERYLRLDVDRREEKSLQAGLYARPRLFLLAECAPEQVTFFFLPDEKSLADQLAAFLSLKLVRCGEREFTLPQPRELVRATWQDVGDALSRRAEPVEAQSKGSARRALTHSGLSKQDAASTLAWIQSLKNIVTFSHISPEGGEPLVLCSDGSALWAGASGKFVPCSWKDAVRQVLEML